MSEKSQSGIRHYLDVVAAYNREEIPVPPRHGRQVQSAAELMDYPFLWAYLTEQDAEIFLMELYAARRRMQ
jgi:hypothetical protein